jgi:hypothetical protein
VTRVVMAVICLAVGLAQAQQPLDPDAWKLVTDRDGIQVYMAHDDDARIKTFRGVSEFDLHEFNSIGAMMDDYDFVATWLHMVSEIEDLGRESPYDREVYVTTRLPWPVSDRDTPLWVGLEQDPETYAVRVPFHHLPERLPEEDSFVRIPQMEGFFLFEPLDPGRVRMTFQVVLDPGGYVPAWLANLILRDIPYFSMKRLARVANLEKYQGVDHGYYKIPPAWQE